MRSSFMSFIHLHLIVRVKHEIPTKLLYLQEKKRVSFFWFQIDLVNLFIIGLDNNLLRLLINLYILLVGSVTYSL